jgi:hypothetical protein
MAPAARGNLSGPNSKEALEDERTLRPSVRVSLKQIKAEMEDVQKPSRSKPSRVTEHKHVPNNRKKSKTHKER